MRVGAAAEVEGGEAARRVVARARRAERAAGGGGRREQCAAGPEQAARGRAGQVTRGPGGGQRAA